MHKLEPEDFERLVSLKPTERPKVVPKSVDRRIYAVHSRRTGNIYEVRLAVVDGQWFAGCNCMASGFAAKCYHLPAAALVNMGARHLRRYVAGLVPKPKPKRKRRTKKANA